MGNKHSFKKMNASEFLENSEELVLGHYIQEMMETMDQHT